MIIPLLKAPSVCIKLHIFWKVTKQKYNHSISCLELKMENVKCGWKVWVTRFSPGASEINIAIHLNLFLSPLPAFFAPFPDLRPLWRPLWPKTLAKNLERHKKCFIVNASWNMSTSLEELPLNSEQPLISMTQRWINMEDNINTLKSATPAILSGIFDKIIHFFNTKMTHFMCRSKYIFSQYLWYYELNVLCGVLFRRFWYIVTIMTRKRPFPTGIFSR